MVHQFVHEYRDELNKLLSDTKQIRKESNKIAKLMASNEDPGFYVNEALGQHLQSLDTNEEQVFYYVAALSLMIKWMKNKPARNMTYFVSQFIDLYAKKFERQFPGEVKCSKGCSFCCYQQVYVTPPEGELISERIKDDPSVLASKENLLLHKSWPKSEKGQPWPESKHALKRCPFLGSEGLCRIYDIRPMACRNHRSGDDPEWCDQEIHPDRSIRFVNQVEIALILSAYANTYGLEPLAHSIRL